MRSPTHALLWAIWRRSRGIVALMLSVTFAGRLADSWAQVGAERSLDWSPLVVLCWMAAFALVFGMFSYTETTAGQNVGGFPRHLFVLPVSTLRLVATPMIAGIAAVELLYLLWVGTLARNSAISPPFVATLLGALMVFYQSIVWTLDRLGPARLVVVGATIIGMYLVALLPSWPPTPPPPWRSEAAIAAAGAGAACVAFLLTWRHVASLRCGGAGIRRRLGFELLLAWIAALMPTRTRGFRTAMAAHVWYEWRCSGLALPALVLAVLVIVIAPASWIARNSAADSWSLLIVTLAMPTMLAMAVGLAFSRPKFWSEDMSLPAFVAVRPLSDEDLVAVKVKVAAASALVSWLLVLAFLAIWLPLWANLEGVSRFAIQLWAFHDQSLARVFGIALLIVLAGIFLTWRFLVSRLWSGLLGSRRLFVASVSLLLAAGAASLVFGVTRLPGWILEDPDRMGDVVRAIAALVVLKSWCAVYTWRRISASYARRYVLFWAAGTTTFVILGLLVWGVVRIYMPLDIDRFQSLVILLALLAVPLGRLGMAPTCLARNRHR